MGDETDDMFRSNRRKQLGLDRGRELRDEGIRRAVDHAEAVTPNWAERAFVAATAWIRSRPAEPFFTHELREALEANGFPPAPNPKAWGGVPKRLVKAGIVKNAGVHYSTKPEQHMAHKSKWVRV